MYTPFLFEMRRGILPFGFMTRMFDAVWGYAGTTPAPAPVPAPAPAPELETVIHECNPGATARVQVVKDSRSGQISVKKQIRDDLGVEGEVGASEVFRNEIEILRYLSGSQHPNIVELLSAQVEPVYVIRLSYCGKELFDCVRRGELDAKDHDEIFNQLCNAMQHLHAHDVVHGDVTLSNVAYDNTEKEREEYSNTSKLIAEELNYIIKNLVNPI